MMYKYHQNIICHLQVFQLQYIVNLMRVLFIFSPVMTFNNPRPRDSFPSWYNLHLYIITYMYMYELKN